jgi:hypothetical protein
VHGCGATLWRGARRGRAHVTSPVGEMPTQALACGSNHVQSPSNSNSQFTVPRAPAGGPPAARGALRVGWTGAEPCLGARIAAMPMSRTRCPCPLSQLVLAIWHPLRALVCLSHGVCRHLRPDPRHPPPTVAGPNPPPDCGRASVMTARLLPSAPNPAGTTGVVRGRAGCSCCWQ